MTKKFSAYVQVHDDAGKYHAFAPGDSVPAWLASKVGDHVLAGAAPAEPEAEVAEEEQQPEPETDEGNEPDFTKPAEAKGAKKAAAKKG